jgi:hypothetical protein
VQRRRLLGTPSRKGFRGTKRFSSIVWSGGHSIGPLSPIWSQSIRSKASAVPALDEPPCPLVALAALSRKGSAMHENKRPRCMQPPEQEAAKCHRSDTKQPHRRMCSAQCRRFVVDGRACVRACVCAWNVQKRNYTTSNTVAAPDDAPWISLHVPASQAQIRATAGARSHGPIRPACQPVRNKSAPHLLLVPGRSFSPQLTLS